MSIKETKLNEIQKLRLLNLYDLDSADGAVLITIESVLKRITINGEKHIFPSDEELEFIFNGLPKLEREPK